MARAESAGRKRVGLGLGLAALCLRLLQGCQPLPGTTAARQQQQRLAQAQQLEDLERERELAHLRREQRLHDEALRARREAAQARQAEARWRRLFEQRARLDHGQQVQVRPTAQGARVTIPWDLWSEKGAGLVAGLSGDADAHEHSRCHHAARGVAEAPGSDLLGQRQGGVGGAEVAEEAASGAAAADPIWPTDERWPAGNPFGAPRPGRTHEGLDIEVAYGEPVYAILPGTVVRAQQDGGYGRLVYVEHPDGKLSAYAHLSRIDVAVGEEVEQGTQLGLSGASGASSDNDYGAHLHFEVWVPGAVTRSYVGQRDAADPMQFY